MKLEYLEIGEYCKLRNGDKSKVIETKAPGGWPVICMCPSTGKVTYLLGLGNVHKEKTDARDIVGKWVEPKKKVKIYGFVHKTISNDEQLHHLYYSISDKNRETFSRVKELDKEIEVQI